jgi:hypothetical protein
MEILITQFSPASCYIIPRKCKYCFQTPSVKVLSIVWNAKFHNHIKQQAKLILV